MRLSSSTPRRGAAAMWALIVLTLLGAVSATAAWHFVATRQALDKREYELQALWLARSGGELAAAKLLADADGYSGETVAPIPESEVRIEVKKIDGQANGYRIRCEARYPVGHARAIGKVLAWTATRRMDPLAVTLEALPVE